MAAKSVNMLQCQIGTVNINKNKETPLENITLNWLSAPSCFKGREETLTQISKLLETNKMVVIHGAPGIGKTETARHFANINSKFFNGNLIWVFAETPQNIRKCFKELAATLDLKTPDVSQVYGKFRKSKCLVIFDNVENMAAVRDFLPCAQLHSSVRVLITSQFCQWDSSVRLNTLKPEYCLDILRHKLRDKFEEYPIEMWNRLVEHLEGIPLLIQIVSSLLHQELRRFRIGEFDLKRFVLTDLISEQTYYNKTVFGTIYSTINCLKTHSVDLLRWMAYLDADRISHQDLLNVPSINGAENLLEIALNDLVDYSLIRVEKDEYLRCIKIKVHRTILLVLREYDLNEQQGIMFKTILKTILKAQMSHHTDSVFKYVNQKEFFGKTIEFYEENKPLLDSFLIYLSRYHCDGILSQLLPNFKNPEILNKMLFEALRNKNYDLRTIDVLINHGARIDETNAFHFSSFWLSTQLLENLLRTNNDIINSKNYLGQTILHLFVEDCKEDNIDATIDCINYLITEWGADVSLQDNDSENVVHTACRNKNISLRMIKYLLKKCETNLINSRNGRDKTPLILLIQWNCGNSDLFEILRCFVEEYKADITIKDRRKWNILFYVCSLGNRKLIEYILNTKDCPKIINFRDRFGDVAFTELIYNKFIKEHEKLGLMKLFIANKMDFNVRNDENKSLVDIAAEEKLMRLSDELKKY